MIDWNVVEKTASILLGIVMGTLFLTLLVLFIYSYLGSNLFKYWVHNIFYTAILLVFIKAIKFAYWDKQ